MPTEIKLPYYKYSVQSEQMDDWLRANAGVGSVRYGGRDGEIKHWLNGDDWLFYIQYPMGNQSALDDSTAVYIFKNERTATEFALRFL